MKQYKDWHGLLVSEEDHAALTTDFTVFGNAFVEAIGSGYGRRINPRDFYIRSADAADGETRQERGT